MSKPFHLVQFLISGVPTCSQSALSSVLEVHVGSWMLSRCVEEPQFSIFWACGPLDFVVQLLGKWISSLLYKDILINNLQRKAEPLGRLWDQRGCSTDALMLAFRPWFPRSREWKMTWFHAILHECCTFNLDFRTPFKRTPFFESLCPEQVPVHRFPSHSSPNACCPHMSFPGQ